MIYSFDPGKYRVGYAYYNPVLDEIQGWGMLDRDPGNKTLFFEGLRNIAIGVPDHPFPATVALIEGQYIKIAKSSKTVAGIAARTMDLVTVAAEIATIMEVMGVMIEMVHPKSWQSIFKGMIPFPRRSEEVKAASLYTTKKLGFNFDKARQDVADAVCMLHWYNQKMKEES